MRYRQHDVYHREVALGYTGSPCAGTRSIRNVEDGQNGRSITHRSLSKVDDDARIMDHVRMSVLRFSKIEPANS